jgi:hypothetical protein
MVPEFNSEIKIGFPENRWFAMQFTEMQKYKQLYLVKSSKTPLQQNYCKVNIKICRKFSTEQMLHCAGSFP